MREMKSATEKPPDPRNEKGRLGGRPDLEANQRQTHWRTRRTNASGNARWNVRVMPSWNTDQVTSAQLKET